MRLSDCCEAKESKFYPGTCPECEQSCGFIVIPTTHEEKTFYLYGVTDMSEFKGEIPFLKKRLELLDKAKTEAVNVSDFNRANDIYKAEKLFMEMIKEIQTNEPISNDRKD